MNKAVLVTTEFRGVFFGYVKEDTKLPAEITLTKVKNCIRWVNTGGFLGLAADGPNKNCKIGREVEEFRLFKITGVGPVSPKAILEWDKL